MELGLFEKSILIGVVIVAIVSFIYSWLLRQDVMKQDTGTEEMKEVWSAIKEGADAYLSKQLKTILPIVVLLTGALFLSVYLIHTSEAANYELAAYDETTRTLILAIGRTIAFLMGASFSLMVGQFGMRIAVHGNLRVAAAAQGAKDENGKLLDVDRRYNKSLSIAYHAGTVTGMLTDGFGLLGGTLIFIILGTAAPDALLGFGFGGTILALFMRVGGGIYTKAADVGADLVGKVEKDIPEDDPRNAAVIADLVGDNVGDCAGMAADIFESYEVTIVSSLILGLFLYGIALDADLSLSEAIVWIMYPLIVRGIGVISSIVGTFAVALWKTPDAEKAMFQSYELSSAITIITSFIFAIFYVGDWRLAFLTATGVMLAVSFNPITARFTSKERGPVQEVVDSMHGGPATTILSGLALGYESSVWAVVTICISFVIAVGTFLILPGNTIFESLNIGIPVLHVSKPDILQYMLYGISLIGIGMLSHTGNNVAMDSFGPISDNAQGIAELTSMDKESTSVLEELDAVGNTTKAITKGIAIASAVIAAVSLFASFVTDIQVVVDNLVAAGYTDLVNPLQYGLRVNIPAVFVGLLLGAALPWIFGAFNIRAVSRAAGDIIEEVRRQFKIPGVMEGTKKPDYERAVSISTSAAQKELVSLAVIAVSVPIMVAIFFGVLITTGADVTGLSPATRATIGSGVEVLGGFQAGIIASGQLLAVFMANAGGAWDNAKKAVEDEPRDLEKNTGKGSERHKAGVVGDTVGDPLKDTAGPAINPMIKVVNLVSLILAPLLVEATVKNDLSFIMMIVAGVLFILFIWAYRKSNRKMTTITS
ncbi:MAG: sodium-translocating pyrophosphatase [Candidatus Heimdallarchaeota archaeon]|nr:MAG: sodium-translocating pyrophosphatase [Candidatus Heimdallarchaeota archaeon]